MKPANDPEERFRLQRERIVDAATAVYSETGYNDARVEHIATRAAVSKRTIYEHFRDLAGLRHAVYERALQATLLKVATLAQDTSLDDPLRTVLLELFRGSKENRPLGQLISYELRQSDPASVAMRQQIVSFFVGAFHDGWLKDYQMGIVPRPPDEVTIRAIVGAAEALALWIIENDPPITPADAADTLINLLRAWCPWKGPGADRGPSSLASDP